jgi:dienelactone hydrolase
VDCRQYRRIGGGIGAQTHRLNLRIGRGIGKQTRSPHRRNRTGREDRTAALIAAELGGLHSDMQEIDRRLKRVDGNTITTMELLTMQSRWHEESDNAVRMLTSQQTEFAHKLEDLRARVDKLEHRPH